MSLQQDARLHLQREALKQRQAELRYVDQRILELQTRLQRKKASNSIIIISKSSENDNRYDNNDEEEIDSALISQGAINAKTSKNENNITFSQLPKLINSNGQMRYIFIKKLKICFTFS